MQDSEVGSNFRRERRQELDCNVRCVVILGSENTVKPELIFGEHRPGSHRGHRLVQIRWQKDFGVPRADRRLPMEHKLGHDKFFSKMQFLHFFNLRVHSVHQALEQDAMLMKEHSEAPAQNLGFYHRINRLGKVSLERMTLHGFVDCRFEHFEIFASQTQDNIPRDGPCDSKVENHIAKNGRRVLLVFGRRLPKLLLDSRQDLARIHLVCQGQNPDLGHGADGPLERGKGFAKGIHLLGERIKNRLIRSEIVLKDTIRFKTLRKSRIKRLQRPIEETLKAHGQETVPDRLLGESLLVHVYRMHLTAQPPHRQDPILRSKGAYLEKTVLNPEASRNSHRVETAVDLGPVKELLRKADCDIHGTLDGTLPKRLVLPDGSQSEDTHHDIVENGRLLVCVDIRAVFGQTSRSLEGLASHAMHNFVRQLLGHRHISSIAKRIITPFGNRCESGEIHDCKVCEELTLRKKVNLG
jgi:hypothetical protein